MLTKEQQETALDGLTVQDAVVTLQLIRRFVKSGQIEDVELYPLSLLRNRLVEAVHSATGVHYDKQATQAAPTAMQET